MDMERPRRTSCSPAAPVPEANPRRIELMYIRVNARDNVGIVVHPEGLQARELIPQSHKIALSDLAPGDPVLRYGQTIGYANRPLARGSWVREDHLEMPTPPGLEDLPLATAVP